MRVRAVVLASILLSLTTFTARADDIGAGTVYQSQPDTLGNGTASASADADIDTRVLRVRTAVTDELPVAMPAMSNLIPGVSSALGQAWVDSNTTITGRGLMQIRVRFSGVDLHAERSVTALPVSNASADAFFEGQADFTCSTGCDASSSVSPPSDFKSIPLSCASVCDFNQDQELLLSLTIPSGQVGDLYVQGSFVATVDASGNAFARFGGTVVAALVR